MKTCKSQNNYIQLSRNHLNLLFNDWFNSTATVGNCYILTSFKAWKIRRLKKFQRLPGFIINLTCQAKTRLQNNSSFTSRDLMKTTWHRIWSSETKLVRLDSRRNKCRSLLCIIVIRYRVLTSRLSPRTYSSHHIRFHDINSSMDETWSTSI